MAISPKRQNQVFKTFFSIWDEPDGAFEQWLREQPEVQDERQVLWRQYRWGLDREDALEHGSLVLS